MPDSPIVKFSQATFSYAKRIALEEITLDIKAGEFVGVIGPNGSGKTTFLKGLLGLMTPVRGGLQIFDCACEALRCHHRARIGYLPQKGMTDPNYPITTWEVAMMGRFGAIGLFRRPSQADETIVSESLQAVGMNNLKDRPFGTLSGGEQQRVLIARALSQRPEILLLDEPTTGIDASAQHQLIDLIRRLHRSYHLTIVFVTHDINMISPFVDSLVLLKTRLYGKGPPQEILTKERLSRVYGEEVIMAERDQRPYIIIHDTHHT
ncbi:MAG: metal ABC transporter ATP-binding protein [Nitrospiria bacterium]